MTLTSASGLPSFVTTPVTGASLTSMPGVPHQTKNNIVPRIEGVHNFKALTPEKT
jgi:hypothetical protein